MTPASSAPSSAPPPPPATSLTTIEPALLTDSVELARIEHAAFSPSELYNVVWGQVQPDDYRASAQDKIEAILRDASGTKRVVKAVRGSVIVGFAVWSAAGWARPAPAPAAPAELPSPVKVEESAAVVAATAAVPARHSSDHPPGTDLAAVKKYFGTPSPKPSYPTLSLIVLVVDPAYQRQRLGRVLLDWGLDLADREGWEVYLRSSRDGLKLYTSAGFIPRPTNGELDPLDLVPLYRPSPISKKEEKNGEVNVPVALPEDGVIVVEPAVESDALELATIQRLAFAKDPIDLNLFANVAPDTMDAHTAQTLRKYMSPNSNKRVFKATRNGEMVGVAAWYLPKLGPQPPSDPMTFAEGSEQDLARTFFDKFDLGVKEPHYYLALLVINPTAQGMGVGRKLLAWGLAQADREGREVYLHSSEVAQPVYERFGFKIWGEPVVGHNGENKFQAQPMRRTASVALEAVKEGDLKELASVYRAALGESAYFTSIFGGVDPQTHDEALIASLVKQCGEEGAKRGSEVVKAVRGGEIVGWVHFETRTNAGPQTALPSDAGPAAEPPMEGMDFALYTSLGKQMVAHRALLPAGEYVHLRTMVTLPSARRTGVAKKLMDYAIGKARASALTLRLYSTEMGLPLYESLGMKKDEAIKVDGGGFEVTPFSIEPAKSAFVKPEVVPATEADLARIGEMHQAAFAPSAMYQACWGACDPLEFSTHFAGAMSDYLTPAKRTEGFELLCVKRGQQTIGYSLIQTCTGFRPPPKDPAPGEEAPKRPDPPRGTDREIKDDFFKRLHEMEERIEGAYLFFHIIVAAPEYQKTGAARAVLEFGFRRAEELGLDAYLDATPEGYPVYTRFGFTRDGPDLWSLRNLFKGTPMRRALPGRPTASTPTVIPATLEDLPRLSQLHRAAFTNGAWFQALWGQVDPSEFEAWHARRLAKVVGEAGLKKGYHLVVAKRGFDILGYGLMHLDLGDKTSGGEEEEKREPQPAGTDLEVHTDFSTRLAALSATRIAGQPHLMFHVVATDPTFARSGAARAVLSYGIALADNAKVGCFIDSTPEGAPVYAKMGFVPDGEEFYGLRNLYHGTPMKRPLGIVPETVVSRALPGDIPRLAQLHFAAFGPGAWFRSLRGEVDPDEFIAWQARRLIPALSEKAVEMGYHLVVARRLNKVVAYGLIKVHTVEAEPDTGAAITPTPAPTPNPPPKGTNLAVQEAYSASVNKLAERIKHIPHVDVYVLATDPAYQRTGGARKVLEYAMGLADEKGIDTYLDSTSEGLPFYTKMGFVQDGASFCEGSHTPLKRKFVPPGGALHAKPTVERATEADLERLAEIHYEAFAPGDIYKGCWGEVEPAAFKAYFKRFLAAYLSEKKRAEGYELLATKRGTQILGYGLVQAHSGMRPTEEEEEEPQPEGTDLRVQGDFFERMHAMERRIKGPYVFFHIIATDPTLFRTGSARAVLEYGIKLGEERGCDCYIDASPDGFPVYSKLGFSRDGEDLVALEDKFYSTPMRRPLPTRTTSLSSASVKLPPPITRLATPADVERIAECHYTAFKGTPVYEACWGAVEPEAFRAFIRTNFGAYATKEKQDEGHHLVVAERNGVVQGYALMQLTEGFKPPPPKVDDAPPAPVSAEGEKPQEKTSDLPGTDERVTGHFLGAMAKLKERLTFPHLYIHAFAVAPEAQRKGVAQALLAHAATLAEKEGVPIYLDSTPAGYGAYVKAGFERDGEDYVSLEEKFRSTPMRRAPTKAQARIILE